mmetsp:Transcript_7131/g.11237  ORF Transcript_7131/g.11237 Transcript_7131/m.11237 type:complete len:88 (-) Transcript_7131:379-642(-)
MEQVSTEDMSFPSLPTLKMNFLGDLKTMVMSHKTWSTFRNYSMLSDGLDWYQMLHLWNPYQEEHREYNLVAEIQDAEGVGLRTEAEG